MVRALAVALLALGIVGCSGSSGTPDSNSTSSPQTAVPVTVTIAGQPAQVWAAGGATRAVVYLHGYNQDGEILRGPQAAILTSLHRAGWTIGADYAHGNAWGDARSVADYKALIRYLRTTEHVRTVVLLGASMGGLATLHLLRAGDATTAVLVSPVTNLASMYQVPAALPQLKQIYGPTAPPAGNPLTWPTNALRDDTITVIADPADPVVPFTTNAQAFAQRFGVKLVQCQGGHAGPSCFAKASFS
jgi:pimeloyl-ACP methyl ester carboxylesterase